MKSLCGYKYLALLIAVCTWQSKSHAQLKAAFTANTTSGCSPLLVQFSDASAGNATSWYWDFGNGSVSSFVQPSTIYYNPGTYTVKLVIRDAQGADSIEKQQFITVYGNPDVAFANSDSVGCSPLNIAFTDKSVLQASRISKWEWDFGDGYTDSIQHPRHLYSTAGSFTVTLKITSDKGCSNSFSKQQNIQIKPRATTSFDYEPAGSSCAMPAVINFINRSVEPEAVSYRWSFGDGGQSTDKNPQHRFVNNGSYTVRLIGITQNGCSDTVQKTLQFANPQMQFNLPTSICTGQPFSVANASSVTPSSVTWDFGDGTKATTPAAQKAYTTAGTYTVKLINRFAFCTDSLSKSINVLPKPVASFTSDRTYSCNAPAPIQFTSTATGAVLYKWDFGDGTIDNTPAPLHTYKSFGSYTVKLFVTASNGCVDSLVRTNYILVRSPRIFIANVPAKGCVPFTMPFSASFLVQDVITSYRWDFGDGTSSTEKSPVKTYTREGKFTVKLVVVTAGGCSDSVTVKDAVQTSPHSQPNFTATIREACASTAIPFINQSVPAGDQWVWLFGDAGKSTEANPIFHYIDTGYFSVTLVVINKGCADTITKPNYIHIKPPVARFTPVLNCNDKFTRSFSDQSIGAQSWNWTFGDGNVGNSRNPVHTYARAGSYRVKLLVTNDGCVDSAIQMITIVDKEPSFAAAKTEVCVNEPVAFTLSDYDSTVHKKMLFSAGLANKWDTIKNLSHTFKQTGSYAIRLTGTDINGCAIFILKPAFVNVHGAKADFRLADSVLCVNSIATFQDRSTTDAANTITQWQWDFGDEPVPETYTQAPFQHRYIKGGVYAIALKVTDKYGCSDSIRKSTITVLQPKANFSSADTVSCPLQPVTFIDSSSGRKLSWAWQFGDGQTASGPSPVHYYSADGVYTVRLLVTDSLGCEHSLEKTAFIKIGTPQAGFTMSDSIGNCPPLQVRFTATATNYEKISWDFGDGSLSTLDNPVHFYNFPGEYYVQQTVTSPGGCKDAVSKKVIVNGPTGTFVYSPLSGCVPLTVRFEAAGTEVAAKVWDFNDGTVVTGTTASMEYTYATPGHYLPSMILIDNQGCRVTIPGLDSVNAIRVTAKSLMNTNRLCNEGEVLFTDQSESTDDITGYYWDFGDGITSTLANPSHIFDNTSHAYTILHRVTTVTGCEHEERLIDTIRVITTPNVRIVAPDEACASSTLTFNTSVIGDAAALQTFWDLGSGPTAAGQPSVTRSYPQPGNYQVQLHTLYDNYCRDTIRHLFAIWPLPATYAGKDTVACQGTPLQLTASGAESYSWQAAPDLSCTSCATTFVIPNADSRYIVTGTSTHGCMASDTVAVRLRRPFTMQVQPGDTICALEPFRLEASGADQYQWSPATGVSDPQAAAPQALTQQTTTYTLVGTDNDHCFYDTGNVTVVVYPNPVVFAGNDTTVATGTVIPLMATGSPDITQWKWTPASAVQCSTCPVTSAAVRSNITYRITATNDGGCTASDDLTITTVCKEGNWFVPNTFSPNGDGVNDVFYIRGKGVHLVRSLQVFNRWGQLVFSKSNFAANDPSAGWDGKVKGSMATSDVYIYFTELVCENSTVVMHKGNVALIR